MNNELRIKNSKKGFTLVEILIVVTIIGILASIILVGLGNFRGRGRDARRIADLNQVQNALELYYTKFQRYPQANAWADLVTRLTSAQIGVSAIPNDPLAPSRANYLYGTSADFQNYVLGAGLEDPANPALRDAPQGTIYGINCGSQIYCVQF